MTYPSRNNNDSLCFQWKTNTLVLGLKIVVLFTQKLPQLGQQAGFCFLWLITLLTSVEAALPGRAVKATFFNLLIQIIIFLKEGQHNNNFKNKNKCKEQCSGSHQCSFKLVLFLVIFFQSSQNLIPFSWCYSYRPMIPKSASEKEL